VSGGEPSAPRWRRYLRFARPNPDADVDDELRFHIDQRIERNVALGMDPHTARRDALQRFGDVDRVRDALVHHDRHKQSVTERVEYMSDLLHDIRFGLRALRRAPAFAVAAILTLATGIGANAAIFSVVDAVVLRPLPYPRPHELASLGNGSAGEYVALKERLRSFSDIAAWGPRQLTVDDGTTAVRLPGAGFTTNLLGTLGVHPLLGRGFDSTESRPGFDPVVILSHGFWQRQFSGSREVLGKRLLIDGVSAQIVGIMPPTFAFPNKDAQFWLPIAIDPSNVPGHWAIQNGRFIARLAPGVTLERADRELREVWPTLRRLNPLWDPGETYRNNVTATRLDDSMVGATSTLLWIIFGSVLLVLLIGCVNVANLLLARATARARELSIRAALGCGRARLVRQLVTESVLLAVIGAAVGIALAHAGVRWLVSMLPTGVPRVEEIAVSGAVLGFTALMTLATAALFGIIPAVRATRYARPSAAFGGGSRGATAGASHLRVTGMLVAAEMAVAVLLGVGAILLVRSFAAQRAIEPGFETTNVVAARLSPPSLNYSEPGRVQQFYERVTERLTALPGVRNVAVVDKLSLAQTVWGLAARIEGQNEDATQLLPLINHLQEVSPAYFATLGIPILRGRAFTEADRPGQQPVAIVSESVARRFWPKDDAVGRRVGYPFPSPWITIVGVVPDTKQDSLRDTTSMSIYVPRAQRTEMSGREAWVLVRGGGRGGELAPLGAAIRAIVREVDRAVPVSDLRTMDTVLADSMDRARFTTMLVGAFALAALLLGAVGIYGVMSYLVGQRTREMGIRIALGAPAAGVLRLVVGRAAVLALAGTVIGIVGSVFASRWLRSLLYEVSATDPVTYAIVPILFLSVAVVASYAPARRATRIDPVRALRAE
jgi:putative ABC transport system permease protein